MQGGQSGICKFLRGTGSKSHLSILFTSEKLSMRFLYCKKGYFCDTCLIIELVAIQCLTVYNGHIYTVTHYKISLTF